MSPKIKSLPSGSSIQRDGLNHQAIEDYLKTIYHLEQEEHPVSTSRIALARDVRPGSVTSMVQRLAKLNLVNYEKHYGVTLTEAGRSIALEVIRHHRLVELFLIEALGFSWDEVHEQADILEHVISEKLEERIAAVLDHPDRDPHGDPIPAKDGSIAVVRGKPLSQLPVGSSGTVSRICDDDDGELLRYLAELGLVPGATVTLLGAEPFEGPMRVAIAGTETIVGYKVATSVLIEARQTR
jgi:DtxR family transcriptional regulator, Mn-dependent transcriptional regulator